MLDRNHCHVIEEAEMLERRLHLDRAYLATSDLENVVGPSGETQSALLVDDANIPGAKPPCADLLRGKVRAADIACHQPVAASIDFAFGPRRNLMPRVIPYGHLEAGDRLADANLVFRRIVGRAHTKAARGLGEPIDDIDARLRQGLRARRSPARAGGRQRTSANPGEEPRAAPRRPTIAPARALRRSKSRRSVLPPVPNRQRATVALPPAKSRRSGGRPRNGSMREGEWDREEEPVAHTQLDTACGRKCVAQYGATRQLDAFALPGRTAGEENDRRRARVKHCCERSGSIDLSRLIERGGGV